MTRFAALAAAAITLAASALPVAAQNLAIDFVNNSGGTVYRLYMSPTHTMSWEADLLGRNVLYPGQSFTVTRANVSNCYYDVLIEWETGYQETDTFDLCTFNQYVIH